MNISNQIIVDLNNQAVNDLLHGRHDDSVATLRTALSHLERYHVLEAAARAYLQPSSRLHVFGTSSLKKSDSPIRSVPLCSDECHSHKSNAVFCSTFSVFCRAFTFANVKGYDLALSQNYDKMVAMILYNMAVALHMQAVANGKTIDLEGALALYEMSFSVIEDAWNGFEVDDLMILLLALFNNMGHIHSVFYNAKQAKICIGWLKTLATNPLFLQLMQRGEYSPFFMNLLVVLKQDEFCCSPAA